MLENLSLERPIAFIDVETTGTDPRSDRVVELSILRIQPDGREEYKSHRVNPGIPIPPEATAVHGITDADVADEPGFRQYARSVRDFLDGCDIAGFNVIKFDLPCLEEELARAGVEFSRRGRHLVDSMVIFHQRERRDLEAAYRKYCGGEMENAHCAEEDAKASAEALGHSSVAFTMDVYSHIIEGMQSDAMALLDEVLPPGKNGTKNKINANLTPKVDITASVN